MVQLVFLVVTGFSFGIASSNKPVEFGIKPTEKPSTTTSAGMFSLYVFKQSLHHKTFLGFKFGVKSTVNTEASKPTLSQQSVLSVLSKTSTATSEPIAAAPGWLLFQPITIKYYLFCCSYYYYSTNN